MHTIRLIKCLFLITLLAAFALGQETWKKIENSSFSFSVPPSFKKTDARGIDSFVEEYVTNRVQLTFDFGMYSNNFGDWPKETKFEFLTIDGKPARIGTVEHEFRKNLRYSTQVYIKLDENTALSMFAACKSEQEVALARKIFETIAFKTK